MTEQLKYLLKTLSDFDDNELDKICSYFKYKAVKKNSTLLSAGEICKEFYYIQKGCLRTYFITQQGNEKTRFVTLNCSIGTALTSFINQKPSLEYIDVLEDTELFVIRYKDFYKLNKELIHWKDFYQRILEMAYSYQNKSIENLITLTAKQRFEWVLKTNPILIQRLSNKILASYLDITQETLSRLKSK